MVVVVVLVEGVNGRLLVRLMMMMAAARRCKVVAD